MLKVKILNRTGKLPERVNPTDAGADLFAPDNIYVGAGCYIKVPLGISIEVPTGTAGFIYARSGIGTKFGIRPRNCVGVIDEKYRGELIVVLENHSNVPYQISKGDRIAQLVIAPVFAEPIVEVEELDLEGDRGGGIGHTGK